MKGNCDHMVGKKLKELRENAGLTQRELAKILDVKSSEISQYEKGKRTPRWNRFNKMLDFFNVSADYVLGREVNVVSDDDEYKIRLSKNDLQMLREIKNYPKLYEILVENPKRSIKVINNNLKNVYPEKNER